MEKAKSLPIGSPKSEAIALRVYQMIFDHASNVDALGMNPGQLERVYFLCSLYFQIHRKSYRDLLQMSKRPEYEFLVASKNWLITKILQLHAEMIAHSENTEKLYFSVLKSGRFTELPTNHSNFWMRHSNQIASLLSQNPKSMQNDAEFWRVFERTIQRMNHEYASLGEK